LNREIAVPLVAAVAGNGDEAAPVAADGGDADGVVADVLLDVAQIMFSEGMRL
jgi:hypothetical protein